MFCFAAENMQDITEDIWRHKGLRIC